MNAAAIALLAVVGAASPERAALEAAFQAGVAAYDAEDYERAIAEWGKLRRLRVEDPAVEYNLGNAYFKRQDYGRAVLHWERTLRLDPADLEAHDNLELVRTLLVDDVPVNDGPLRVAIEAARRVARPESTARAAFIAWQLLGVSGLLALVARGSIRRLAISLAVATTVAVVVTAPIAWIQIAWRDDRSRHVILAPVVEARSGPGEQFTTVVTVHEGLVVRSDGGVSGWERVRLANGLDAWVPAGSLERI